MSTAIIKENPKTTILIVSLTHGLGLVCQLGFNFLIFRQFSLAEVGAYGLIISLAAFVGFALELGITQVSLRGFSQSTLSLPQALAGSAVLRIPLLGLSFAALAGWVYFTPTLRLREVAALALAISCQFLISFRAIATSWLRAHDRQNLANLLNLLGPLGYFSAGLLLVYFHKFSLLVFFVGILTVQAIIISLSFLFTVKNHLWVPLRKYFTVGNAKQAMLLLLKPGLVFAAIGFCQLVQNRLDWILVYAYKSDTELAYYSLANKIFEVFESSIDVMIMTFFPWLCKMAVTKDENPKIVVGIKGIIFVGMVLAVATALCLPGYLTTLWGQKFERANDMIFWLMCGASFTPVTFMMYYLLVSAGRERYLLVTSVIPVIMQIGTDLVLIPRYGGIGAIIGMLVFFFSSFCLLATYLVRNGIFKYLLLAKFIILYMVTNISLYLLQRYLQQTILNRWIFVISLFIFGSWFLFSKSEWFLVLAEAKTSLRSIIKLGR